MGYTYLIAELIEEGSLEPDDLPLMCEECGEVIEGEVCSYEEGYFHEPCCEIVEARLEEEARDFAFDFCAILARPTKFDPAKHRSKRVVDNCNRHNCTNYDDLLWKTTLGPSDSSLTGCAYRDAICDRIQELLEEAVDDDYEDEEPEED